MRLSMLFSAVSLLFLLSAVPLAADEFMGEIKTAPSDLMLIRSGGLDFVSLTESGMVFETGCPAVPCREINVALPTGSVVTGVEVVDALFTELPGEYDLAPCTRPRRVSNPGAGNSFVKNPAIYGTDAFYPAAQIKKLSQWDLAGQEFVTVRLNPVRFNPVTGKLALAEKMVYRIVYSTDPGAVRKTYNFSSRVRARTMSRLEKMAVNPEAVTIPPYAGSGSRALAPGDFEHIIITTSSLAADFEPVKDYRTSIGMPSDIVTLDWIYANYSGSDNQERIQNFVIDAHSTWGTIYFFLGGDTGQIPYRSTTIQGDSIPNDTYLADYDRDFRCEVYVGRAPVDNSSQISTLWGKTYDMETNPPAGYGDEAFLMGFDLDSSHKDEKLMNYIISHWLPAWTDLSKEYDSESGGHENDVDGYVNDGQVLIGHSDHCNWDVVGVGSYRHGSHLSISECQAFSNGSKQSIMKTLGCWPGAFEKNDCWGEEFVKDSNGGGIGFVGNSRYGWYSPGFVLAYSGRTLNKFFKVIWDEEYLCSHAGEALGEARNDFWPEPGYYQYIFTELNLQGDPAATIWTDVPSTPTVVFDTSISTGWQSYLVNVSSGGSSVEGALVCVQKGTEVYERGTTDSSGNVTLDIDPATTGTMTVTVSGLNLLPTVGSCTVSGGPPDLEVDIVLDNTTYQRGTQISYDVTVTNNTTGQLTTSMWTNVTLPDFSVYPGSGYLDGPVSVTVNGNDNEILNFSRIIPAIAPAGSYSFNVYVGPAPGYDDEDHEAFTVTL